MWWGRAFPSLLQVLGLLCSTQRAWAQLDECVASTVDGFDYQVTVDADFTIYWTVDTANEEITVQAIYDGEGWVAVGFSPDGQMVVADAVIGLPDDGTALEHDLTAYSTSGVTESSSQEISGATVTQTGSVTTLVFTRPLSPADSDKVVLSAEEGDETIFIWAWGVDNTLDFHSAWGAVTLGDLYCAEAAAVDDDDDDSADSTDTAASCTSSDPEFDFEVALADDLALFWVVVDNEYVSVKAVYQAEAYLAIGFSDSGRMPGSDAVIGLPDNSSVLEYDMDDYSTPVESSEQELMNATVTQADGVTTLTFVRPLEPVGDGKQAISLTESTVWLYAWGGDNNFQQHAREGAVSLGLTSCSVGSAGGGGTKKEYAHAWLMVIGWSVFFPIGIMYARFAKSFANIGFPYHRALQSTGAILALAGFFLAISFTEDSGKDHFDNTHGKAGVVLIVLLVLQVLAAACRPSPLPSNAASLPPGVELNPTKTRMVWSFLHRSLGYIAVIWAVLQCFGGLDLLDVKDEWTMAYTVVVAVLVVAFFILQVAACLNPKARNTVRQLSQPQIYYPTTGLRRG